MVSVVFDTMVFVRALINPFGLWGRVLFQYADTYRLFLSTELRAEVIEVLARPAVRRKIRRPTEEIERAFARLLDGAEMVVPVEVPTVSRDPKDDKVLAAAKAAQAKYLVTEDQDLLVLEAFEGIEIVPAARFLAILTRGDSEDGAPR